MNILTSIFYPRDKPENRTTGSAYTLISGLVVLLLKIDWDIGAY